MPIPDYETVMLPLLQITGDKKEHELNELVDKLSDHFKLTAEDRQARLPSGLKPIIYSRVHWAKTYLKSAGLLESTARGKFRVTQRGIDALKVKPDKIDGHFLNQFPEFIEFKKRSQQSETAQVVPETLTQTPEELLESSYQNLRQSLAEELLEKIKSASPRFFEELVIDLLLAMGYGGSRKDASAIVGKSGDSGIDGIIKEDKLGLDAVYIQAKRWDAPVGRPIVQSFVGSLEGNRATKGVLITTSEFAKPAIDYVKTISKKIVLIDGETLAQLMIDHDVGVTEVASYRIKKVDSDYFGEE